jgi:biotin carboxylase
MREHLRLPGMGDSVARHFRDKLAMRVRAKEAGIPVPDFVGVLNYDAIREFTERTPAPWMFKPRMEASASGITKIESTDQLWRHIESKGDRQSHYLLEQYLPGDVYHVDSIISEGQVIFAGVHRCGKPPFDVAHGGGIYTSVTVERGSSDDTLLRALNTRVLAAMGHFRGVSHVEFIKGRHDGQFYMLECAARVGGAHTAELVEAANGVNLWEEWANVEIDCEQYKLPPTRGEYAGLLMTLSKQEHPDFSKYTDPELFYRAPDAYHAGAVLRSPSLPRVHELLETYGRRFYEEFHTVLPASDRPVH